jgi:hypothetical protein
VGSEGATFPLCEVQLRRGLRLYFGADPVRSLMLVASGDRAYRALAAAGADYAGARDPTASCGVPSA